MALLRKETCNLRHPVHFHHPVHVVNQLSDSARFCGSLFDWHSSFLYGSILYDRAYFWACLSFIGGLPSMCCGVLQCDAECCSVLQCVAVCCSVLQCVAVSVLQLVCCSVLHCWERRKCTRGLPIMCYSVLQCVAVCCSVLWWATVCCS